MVPALVYMKKRILYFFSILIIGGLGGALLSNIFARNLSRLPGLSGLQLSGQDQTVIVNKTEQVFVEQSVVLKKAIDQNLPALVAIKSFYNDTLVSGGIGFVVGADGLVLTRKEWVNSAVNKISIEKEGKVFPAEILKKDDDNGLVLLKANISNLPVVSFSNTEVYELGEFVFLLGTKYDPSGKAMSFINSGILKTVGGKVLDTNIDEDFKLATGAPLINAKGEVVGIAAVNSSGQVFAISSQTIKEFVF